MKIDYISSQSKYITSLLKRAKMEDSKPLLTSWPTSSSFLNSYANIDLTLY